MKNKLNFKALKWLLLSYPFGYLAGVVVITFAFLLFEQRFFLIPVHEIGYFYLVIGIYMSFLFYVCSVPIFVVLSFCWNWICKKYKNFDASWWGVAFFTFVIGTIATLAYPLIIGGVFIGNRITYEEFYGFSIFPITLFLGGWLGTFLPRLIFRKKLGPGKIFDAKG